MRARPGAAAFLGESAVRFGPFRRRGGRSSRRASIDAAGAPSRICEQWQKRSSPPSSLCARRVGTGGGFDARRRRARADEAEAARVPAGADALLALAALAAELGCAALLRPVAVLARRRARARPRLLARRLRVAHFDAGRARARDGGEPFKVVLLRLAAVWARTRAARCCTARALGHRRRRRREVERTARRRRRAGRPVRSPPRGARARAKRQRRVSQVEEFYLI